jgi:glycerol-3-phosphate cytidylyltransferase-like family protein
MPEQERKEIIEALRVVDRVVLTGHEADSADMSVCTELRALKPDIFGNGGDRHAGNIPEYALCDEIGIEMAFNLGHGGKVQSSSELARKVKESV